MTQNEFIEHIKRIMTEAKKNGWSAGQIEDYAIETVLEWVEEYEKREASKG